MCMGHSAVNGGRRAASVGWGSITCSMPGLSGLSSGRVSTCSGTKRQPTRGMSSQWCRTISPRCSSVFFFWPAGAERRGWVGMHASPTGVFAPGSRHRDTETQRVPSPHPLGLCNLPALRSGKPLSSPPFSYPRSPKPGPSATVIQQRSAAWQGAREAWWGVGPRILPCLTLPLITHHFHPRSRWGQ